MKQKSSGFSTFLKGAGVALCLLMAIMIVSFACVGGYDWHTHSQIAELEEKYRLAGEPTTFQELEAFRPTGSDEMNAALVYAKAIAVVEKDPHEKRIGEILESLSELAPPTPLPDALRSEIADILESEREVFAILSEASQLPEARYPIHYERGLDADLAHLKQLRSCARIEALRCAYAADLGQVNVVIESQEHILHIAGSLVNEPDAISQLVRIAIHNLASDHLAAALGRCVFSEDALKDLANLYASAEDPDTPRRTYVAERCTCNEMLHMMARNEHPSSRDNKSSEDEFNDENDPFLKAIGAFLVPPAHVIALEKLDELVAVNSLPWPDRLRAVGDIANSINRLSDTKLGSIAQPIIAPLGRLYEAFARDVVNLRTARVALAVEQFRIQNGALPASLDQLVPSYLSTPLEDPFNGKSFHYVKLPVGYTIYSVYADLLDNQGVKAEKDANTIFHGDWPLTVAR